MSDSEGDDELGVIPAPVPAPRRPRPKHQQHMMMTPTRALPTGGLPSHAGTPLGVAMSVPSPSAASGASGQRKSRSTNRVGDLSDTATGLHSHSRSSHMRHDSDGVDDDATSSPRVPAGAQSMPLQFGRHGAPSAAPSHSQSASASQRRKSKVLQPSSLQKKRSNTLETGGGGGGGAAKKLPSSYVASRVWKNESTLTFGARIKMAEDPSLWADLSLAVSNILDVWQHYDCNGDDILNPPEVAALANDLVDRFVAQYRDQVSKEHPGLTEAELAKTVKRDVFPHLLAGSNLVEAKRVMTDRLKRELDLDRNNQISKLEFCFAWKDVCRQVLSGDRTNKTESLSCAIL